MKNLKINSEILSDYHRISLKRNIIVNGAIQMALVSWLAFDYFLEPKMFEVSVWMRSILPSLFLGFLFVNHYVKKLPAYSIMAVFKFVASIFVMYFYLNANNKLEYMLGYSTFFILAPLLLHMHPKYQVPYLLVPIFGTMIYHKEMMAYSEVSFPFWCGYMFIILMAASINVYFVFKNSLRRMALDKAVLSKNRELEERNKDINSLVRLLSHDLKNSMTIISGNAKKLDKRGFADVPLAKTVLSRILRGVKNQERLLDRVRDHLALKDGKKSLTLVPVRFSDIFEQAHFMFRSHIEEKDIKLLKMWDEKIEILFLGDEVLFSNTIFNNLISNAIKFSNIGGKIEVTAYEQGDFVYITVKDEGLGMDEEMINGLFSFSDETNRLGTQGETGTGYGMPLVHQYVLAHGGEITVESKTGENSGTLFTLKLKRAKEQEQSLAA